jgi:hypothetical protein
LDQEGVHLPALPSLRFNTTGWKKLLEPPKKYTSEERGCIQRLAARPKPMARNMMIQFALMEEEMEENCDAEIENGVLDFGGDGRNRHGLREET